MSVTLEQCPEEQAEYQKRLVLYLKSVNWNVRGGKDAHARELFYVYLQSVASIIVRVSIVFLVSRSVYQALELW